MRIERPALGRLTVEMPPNPGPCLRFAAAELCRYLATMSGVDLAVRSHAGLGGAILRLGEAPEVETPPAPDGFRIAAGERGVAFAGAGERAVLYAVYRFLEDLGCVWSLHGEAHESVPPLPADGMRVADVSQAPAYEVRAYATDIHTFHYREPEVLAERLPADAAFVDWMGKSGANAFLFIRHPYDTQLTIPELLPELGKRGITPEYGGHVLPLLLPRERYAEHPEWFPLNRHGQRSDLGNLCSSSSEALAVASAAAVEYAKRHPEMGVLHVWGADLWDGGWCHCAACAAVSVQDQSLRVCNAVAAALETARLPLAVCYLAYHDTIEANLRLAPHPNVWVEFAPRERCYGHAIDDAACAVNPRYREAFERYAEIFAGRMRVFEYYGDAILFCGVAVPLTAVIEADLAYYRRAGAASISFLQFGSYSLWAHPLNFAAFADGTGRRAAGAPKACLRYPSAFWADVEQAMAAVVTYGDVRRPPRRRAEEIRPRLEAAVAVLSRWTQRLEADPLDQRRLLEYTRAVLEGVVLQLARTPTAAAEAEARYQRALDILGGAADHSVGVWGRRDLPVIHSFHSAASRRV
jgi:hypothetical protein